MNSFEVGDGIVLRPFRIDDAESVLAAVSANYDHLRPYMHWAVPDYSLEHARTFIKFSIEAAAARSALGFGIFCGEQVIGDIGLVSIDEISKKTEIGYWIDQSYEGKGIISRACKLLIKYSFSQLGMNRVEIRCSTENRRSAAIPERLGFTLEGTLRQSEVRDGRFHDFAVYGLLATEWDG